MDGERGRSAALEAIERIREAEEKARLIIEEARDSTAAEILRRAVEEAKRIREETLALAKKEAEAEKKKIIERAIQEAEEISLSAVTEAKELERRATTNMEAAVEQIALKIKKFLEEGAW